MLDDFVTTMLEALALLAVAGGVAMAIGGPLRIGLGLVAGGLVLIGSTSALTWWGTREPATPEGGQDEPGQIRA